MSPPPEDGWGEEEEAGDYDAEAGAGGYEDEEGDEDYDSEWASDEDASSCSSGLPMRCWPDPFDEGTEASTPATSSRAESRQSSKDPAIPFGQKIQLPEDSPPKSEAAVHSPLRLGTCASGDDGASSGARARDWRQCPQSLWSELYSSFSPRVVKAEIVLQRCEVNVDRKESLAAFTALPSSMPCSAWAALFAQFPSQRPAAPEAAPAPAVAAAPPRLVPPLCGRNPSKQGSSNCSGEGDFSRMLPPTSPSPSPPLSRPHHGRPRGRQPPTQSPCSGPCSGSPALTERSVSYPTVQPDSSPMRLGDFRSCPTAFWATLHEGSSWASCRPTVATAAVGVGGGGLLGGVSDEAASSRADVTSPEDAMWRWNREPRPPQTPPEGAAALLASSSFSIGEVEHVYDLELSVESGIEEDDEDTDSEEYDDDEYDDSIEGACFFISTGGALATVPEETSYDLSYEGGPSASLQAYVAATGALVTPPTPPPAPTPSAQDDEAEEAAVCIQMGWRRRCLSLQAKVSAAIEYASAFDDRLLGLDAEASEEDSAEALLSEAEDPGKPMRTMEEVLRAQIDAKQVLMSVVLKVIFALQLTEAPEPSPAPADPQPAHTCAGPSEPEAAPLIVEADEPQEEAEKDEPPVVVAALEETDDDRSCEEKSSRAPEPNVPKPPDEPPASGKRPTSSSSSSSRPTEASGADAKAGAARKIIRVPRGKAPVPTRPRQQLPKPDKRPPVPRAPRPQAAAMAKLEDASGTTVPSSSAAPKSAVIPEELVNEVCYEVSDEEFGRLLRQGAVGSGKGNATGVNVAPAEAYEVSEEEFERLLQSGQLCLPTEEDEAACLDLSRAPNGTAPSTMEISEEMFQQLLVAGALQPDMAEMPEVAEYEEEYTPIPPATGEPALSRPRRHSEPKASARPPQSKAAPKRSRGQGLQPKAEGGGLFFMPTDVPAVSSRAPGGQPVPFQSSADMASRVHLPQGGSRASSSAASASSTEAPPLSEQASSMDMEAAEQQRHEQHCCSAAVHQAAVAGSPLHSARLLRDRAGPHGSVPSWPEEFSQRRSPKAPMPMNFKTPGKLPFINLRGARTELGFDPRQGAGGAPSAPCTFGDDGRGLSPYDDDEDGQWAESRSLPAKLAPSGHETVWPEGVMHFRSGLPGKRAPRKLAPLPY